MITLQTFPDNRGYFAETWNLERHSKHALPVSYAQDNISKSKINTLRGIHFQVGPYAQGKLVGVAYGHIYDVVVDLRPDSPTFKKWKSYNLYPSDQLYIPPGFGHGFLVRSEEAIFTYKCTAPYAPDYQYAIAWNDPEIGIKWPVDKPILGANDEKALPLGVWIEKFGIDTLRHDTYN